MFEPDVKLFKEMFMLEDNKHYDEKYNVLNYEIIIDLNDIFTF